MAKPTTPRTIRCYHCGHGFDVSAQTMTTVCPKCSKPLTVEDVVIKTAHAVRRIQTCGRLIVQKKGRVIAQSVEAAGGVQVEGILEAKVTSGGKVWIGPKGQWRGDCAAPSLEVEEGGRIDGGFFEIAAGRDGLPAPAG